jgi:hypothetical protein
MGRDGGREEREERTDMNRGENDGERKEGLSFTVGDIRVFDLG